jgi:hypothetical protein
MTVTTILLPDPVPALQSLGYTKREAAFLYLVAAHSGYFLRRQFDYFIDRNKGALVVRFLEKASAAGHIEAIDYKQGWRVYHLSSRTIYRILGDPESQLRHRKGDTQIRARLMALDYVLEHENDHFLESEADRIRFFERGRRITPNVFTNGYGRLEPLLGSFPISLIDRSLPDRSLVRFAFIDEGLLSIGKFARFLGTAEPLLRAVGNFEVIYVAVSGFNFPAAREVFRSRFFRSSHRSERLFAEEVRTAAIEHRVALHPQFTTLLFEYSYPKLQGSEIRGSREGSQEGK